MPEPLSPTASVQAFRGSPPPRATKDLHASNRSIPGYLSPPLRKLAKTRGVDLQALMSTLGTKVRRTDILRAGGLHAASAPAGLRDAVIRSAGGSAPMGRTEIDASGVPDRGQRDPRGSLTIAAQLTQVHEFDAGTLSNRAHELSSEPGNAGTASDTLEALLILAVAATLQEHAVLNAQYDQDRREITYHAHEHIAFETTRGAHRRGLLVDAGDLTVAQAVARIADIKARTTSSGTPSSNPEPTFTVVNIGAVQALFESPIIHQPQVGILALGAVVKRLVVRVDPFGQEVTVIRPMMYLSLTYDHRLVDGANAGRFLQTLIGRLTSEAFYTSLP